MSLIPVECVRIMMAQALIQCIQTRYIPENFLHAQSSIPLYLYRCAFILHVADISRTLRLQYKSSSFSYIHLSVCVFEVMSHSLYEFDTLAVILWRDDSCNRPEQKQKQKQWNICHLQIAQQQIERYSYMSTAIMDEVDFFGGHKFRHWTSEARTIATRFRINNKSGRLTKTT